MNRRALRDFIVSTVWDLLGPRVSAAECCKAGVEVRLTSSVDTSPGQALVQTARGGIIAGYPVQKASTYSDQVALLGDTADDVMNYMGFAATSAADGELVVVWFAGPTDLFVALPDPVLPGDTDEFYVYGPHPPALYSAIPGGSWHRSCGLKLNSTTILAGRGSVVGQK